MLKLLEKQRAALELLEHQIVVTHSIIPALCQTKSLSHVKLWHRSSANCCECTHAGLCWSTEASVNALGCLNGAVNKKLDWPWWCADSRCVTRPALGPHSKLCISCYGDGILRETHVCVCVCVYCMTMYYKLYFVNKMTKCVLLHCVAVCAHSEKTVCASLFTCFYGHFKYLYNQRCVGNDRN